VNQRSRGGASLGAVAILMLNTIRRMAVYGMRPVDLAMLVIEIAVLVMIILGWDVASALHRRKEKQRAAQKQTRLARALSLISSGTFLQKRVPRGDAVESAIEIWAGQVDAWILDTHRFLMECSRQAEVTFLDDSSASDAWYPGVAIASHKTLQMLVLRMGNLRTIANNPEFYF
jgi:hypothetical protein